MPVQLIKPSFGGGEYAPSLWSRVDLARYASGAKKLLNFFVHTSGGASNRAGTFKVKETKTSSKKVRVIPFEYSTEQAYVIEFGEYYCRIYYGSGDDVGLPVTLTTAEAWVTTTPYAIGQYVEVNSSIFYCISDHTASTTFAVDLAAGKWITRDFLEVPTPYDEDEIFDLKYTQSADVLFLFHPDHAPQQLNRNSDTSWELVDYDYQNGPFLIPNTDSSKSIAAASLTGSGITLTVAGFTMAAGHVGSLWKLSHDIESQSSTESFTGTGNGTSIKCFKTWRLITHGTWTGEITIQKSVDGGTNWTNLMVFSSVDDFNANTYNTEDEDLPFLVRAICSAYTSGTIDLHLSADAFTQEGIVKITAVTPAVTADVLQEIGSTDATIDFSEGAWSDYRGWPSTGEFCPDDRLVTANTKTNPQTNWLTKASNYYNYGRSIPLVDSDGITVDLPSRKVNGIQHLVPLSELVVLTSACEGTIESVSGASLSPTTVRPRIYGYEGAAKVKPVVIGNRAIYVQALGSMVRDIGYELASYSFTGTDLSVLANHFFQGYNIVEMAYQRHPDRIVWCVRDDGRLLSMTYMREQEVLAWTQHNTQISGALPWVTGTAYVAGGWIVNSKKYYKCNTSHTSGVFATDLAAGKWTETDIYAKFESVCSIPGDDYDEVWFVVNREGTRFIERMANRMTSTEPEDQFFVDCGITYDDTPTDTITNLDHLEGLTVAILADGNVLPQQVVVDGQVSLGADYSKVHVGIPYVADLIPLNVELNTASGTIQGKKIKIAKVALRVINSRGGWIGQDEDSLFEIMPVAREQYDVALDLYTGLLKESLSGGYSDDGSFLFRQIDPLPVTIAAAIPEVAVGGMSGV